MGTRFVRCLALAVFAVLPTMTWVTGAGAQVTLVSACGTLSTFGETYKLIADLVSAACGDCLIVANNRITVDMQNHKISQGAGCGISGSGVTDSGTARDQIIVKNGEISDGAGGEQFVFGINLGASTRTEVRNVYSHDNLFDGIFVGNQSIVAGLPNVMPKTCRSVFNTLGAGIFGLDRVQVQNCEASNNGFHGIEVGNRCLVTRNIANDNGHNGINAGTGDEPPATQAFCDVTFNTANNNGTGGEGSGIDVEGSNSLVTGNTTNNNVEEGLEVQCPSTVTNNNSSGNGTFNYVFEGPGTCFTNNNN